MLDCSDGSFHRMDEKIMKQRLRSIAAGSGLLFITLVIAPSLSSIANAETLTLNSVAEGGNSNAFAGLLLPGNGTPDVGVVLLHGRGADPDGPVVKELRQSLNAKGYTTLSIQEPIPAGGTLFQDYINDVTGPNFVFPETYARVRTAVNVLRARGVQKVVVLGFDMGSRLASAHVARGQMDELPIVGLVGVGMEATSIPYDPLNVSFTLDEVTVPVLDIYGDADTTAINTAPARLRVYNPGTGTSYTQVMVECADATIDCVNHEFFNGNTGMEYKRPSNPVLDNEVAKWMTTHAPLRRADTAPPMPPHGLGVQ